MENLVAAARQLTAKLDLKGMARVVVDEDPQGAARPCGFDRNGVASYTHPLPTLG